MTKQEIDNYFTKNHKEIDKYIRSCQSQNGIYDEDSSFMLSELYLNVIKKIDKIKDEQHLKYYISNYIYSNNKWVNGAKFEMPTQYQNVNIDEVVITTNDENLDFELILGEINYQNFNAINELYRQSQKTIYKQVIWDAYFIAGATSAAKFEKFTEGKINKYYAKILLSEMKEDIRNFANNFLNT
jgi:hypothetical protein